MRWIRVVLIGSMTVSMFGVVLGVAPAAYATTVSTEAELRAAFANDAQVDLANDITLTDCGTGVVTRNSATALMFEGHGFTVRQTCDDGVFEQTGTGAMTFQNVTITGANATGAGGGINTAADLTVTNSTFHDNTGGGAINVDDPGVLTVTSSTFVDNHAPKTGGGALSVGEGTVMASTFVGNDADVGGAIGGRALTIINSTITGNTATTLGGGIFLGDGQMTLVYTDVVANSSATGANIDVFFGPTPMSSFGSVVALPQGGGQNCVVGNPSSLGFNFSDDDSCGFTGPTDRQNAGDPLLGALGDNGGPTPTRVPQTGSPLLDFIPLADCTGPGDPIPPITTDQRGVTRPQGSGCDIGAVEVEVIPPPPPTPIEPIVVRPRFTG